MKNNLNIAIIRTSEGYESINIMDYEESYLETLDIVKIGNKQLKPYLYFREFNLTLLDKEELRKYGLQPKVYKYVGVSTEYNFKQRTSKWVVRSKGNDNIIGNLLRKLEKLLNDRGEDSISLIDYVHKKSKILNYFDTVEQAKSCEKSLIGIIQLEQEKWGLDVVCLNINDKPIKVNEQGYELRL